MTQRTHQKIAALLLDLVLVFCLAFANLPVQAGVPGTLNYQGQLSTATNVPVNATVSMTFSLYLTPTGGTALWSETLSVVVSNGQYTTTLGKITPLTPSMFGTPAYLGIRVESDAEMSPRMAVSSTPFALKAEDALTVGGLTPAQLQGAPGPAGPAGPIGPAGPSAVDANGNLAVDGYIKLGGGTAVCNGTMAGVLRWTGSQFEACNGRSWTVFAVPAPVCNDAIKNGSETDIDWGGSCPQCSLGRTCSQGADCISTNCLNGICAQAGMCHVATDCPGIDSTCSVRTCNGGMCGRSFAPDGTSCGNGASCQSGLCQ